MKYKKRKLDLSLFTSWAYARSHDKFQNAYDDLKTLAKNVMEDFIRGAQMLWKISLGVHHLIRVNAFFLRRRYGVRCSNMAESYNSWVANEQNMPITTTLDQIHMKIMKQMPERHVY